MISYFTASNGVKVRCSTPVHLLHVEDDSGKELTVTLIHSHFDEGVFRNAGGTHSKKIRKAVEEYCESLGIEQGKMGREDGSQKTLIKRG